MGIIITIIIIIIAILIVSMQNKRKKIIGYKKPKDITNLLHIKTDKTYVNPNKISYSKQLCNEFVALDLETADLDPTNDKINETASIKDTIIKSIPIKEIFTEEELGCYDFVKNIIIKHNRDIKCLHYSHTGQYFNVIAPYNVLRIKLKGKKHYLISRKSIKELELLNSEFQYEACPKSETGTTRIIITNSYKDIINFENLIIENFDKA